MKKAIQCYDGDGNPPVCSPQLSDGLILRSARIRVPQETRFTRHKKLKTDEWVDLSISRTDHLLLDNAIAHIWPKYLYLPRRTPCPLKLCIDQKIDQKTESYFFNVTKNRWNYIIRCTTIEFWEMPQWDGGVIHPSKWFTPDEYQDYVS